MNTPEVRGQFIAPVTPFTADGDLMVDAFAEILRWHLESGAGGFLIAGDNGEGWALTDAELGHLTEAAKTEAAGRVPIFTGAGAITAQRTIELCDVAARAGADGLCLQPQPYVLNGTKAEICRRFELVSRAVPLPIMLYNNPARTGLNLGVDVLEGICDVAPVVALKEASADFVHVTDVIRAHAERFAILVGCCQFILPGLELGAAGYLSTAPELWGKRAKRIMAFETLSLAEKREIHFAITDVFATLMGVDTRPAALKAALNLLGRPAGFPREPVQRLSPQSEAVVREVLVRHGLLDKIGAQRAAQ